MDALIGWVLAAGGGAIVFAGLVFGFAPVIVAKVFARAFPKNDPRRAEMVAEIYKVAYKSRVTWLFEQFARVLTEAIPARWGSAKPAVYIVAIRLTGTPFEIQMSLGDLYASGALGSELSKHAQALKDEGATTLLVFCTASKAARRVEGRVERLVQSWRRQVSVETTMSRHELRPRPVREAQ